MSSLYLFRHGQAGLRDRYDTLSETGRLQASLLGRYLAARNIRFSAFFTGALDRQKQSAACIRAAYQEARLEIPEIIVEPAWNEFDLDAVYASIAPQLAAEDPEFCREYEALRAQTQMESSPVHRRWTKSDILVTRAWVEGRFPQNGESFPQFKQRIGKNLAALTRHTHGECIAVSTSATPIGIFAGLALELQPRHVMRLAGSLYNSSFTSFRLRDGDLALFSFNNIPHLADQDLRTFR